MEKGTSIYLPGVALADALLAWTEIMLVFRAAQILRDES